MAGSVKWFTYTADNGTTYAMKRDESNLEAVNGSTGDYTNSSTTVDALPRNLKPRKAVYRSSDGTVTRECICVTAGIFNSVETTTPTIVDQTSGLTLSIVRKVGEVRQIPFAQDTSQQDGDAT